VYTNSSPLTSYINEDRENGQSGLLLAKKPQKPGARVRNCAAGTGETIRQAPPIPRFSILHRLF
jgi:hypothetical protein